MPDYQLIILLFLLILALVAKATADAQAHGSPRLARWFPRWAGPESWRLKYQADGRTPRFWLSTTVLVFATDLWHFANFLAWACWASTCLLACYLGRPALWWVVAGLAAGKLLFQPLYAWLRK